jgi:hypothetical protein
MGFGISGRGVRAATRTEGKGSSTRSGSLDEASTVHLRLPSGRGAIHPDSVVRRVEDIKLYGRNHTDDPRETMNPTPPHPADPNVGILKWNFLLYNPAVGRRSITPISLPWARWFSIPIAVFSAGMAGSFWEDRGNPAVLFFFGLAGLLGYVALSLLFNRTSLSVEDACVVVRHRPVPWPGMRLSAETISALMVSSRQGRDTNAVSWELSAVLKSGQTVRLTWGPIAGHRYDLLDKAAHALAAGIGVPVR